MRRALEPTPITGQPSQGLILFDSAIAWKCSLVIGSGDGPGVVVRSEAARDRELRVLASGQSDVDRAFMESEYAKAKAAEHRAQTELTELKAKHELLQLEHKGVSLEQFSCTHARSASAALCVCVCARAPRPPPPAMARVRSDPPKIPPCLCLYLCLV